MIMFGFFIMSGGEQLCSITHSTINTNRYKSLFIGIYIHAEQTEDDTQQAPLYERCIFLCLMIVGELQSPLAPATRNRSWISYIAKSQGSK